MLSRFDQMRIQLQSLGPSLSAGALLKKSASQAVKGLNELKGKAAGYSERHWSSSISWASELEIWLWNCWACLLLGIASGFCLLLCADSNGGAVLIAARDHKDLMPLHSMVSGEYIGRQVAAGQVTQVE